MAQNLIKSLPTKEAFASSLYLKRLIRSCSSAWTELMAFVHCFSVGVQSLTLTAHRTIAQWYVLVRILSGKQSTKLAIESSLPFRDPSRDD